MAKNAAARKLRAVEGNQAPAPPVPDSAAAALEQEEMLRKAEAARAPKPPAPDETLEQKCERLEKENGELRQINDQLVSDLRILHASSAKAAADLIKVGFNLNSARGL